MLLKNIVTLTLLYNRNINNVIMISIGCYQLAVTAYKLFRYIKTRIAKVTIITLYIVISALQICFHYYLQTALKYIIQTSWNFLFFFVVLKTYSCYLIIYCNYIKLCCLKWFEYQFSVIMLFIGKQLNKFYHFPNKKNSMQTFRLCYANLC